MGTATNNRKQVDDAETSINDYMQKITEAIEEEANRAKELAEEDAANIITKARQRAEQITKEALTKAEEKSAKYMAELKQKAEQEAAMLEEEARSKAEVEAAAVIANAFDESQKILGDATQTAEQEAAKILADSRKDADRLAGEAVAQREKEIDEVRSKVLKEFDECPRLISEARQKLEQPFPAAEATASEPEPVSEIAAKPDLVKKEAVASEPVLQAQAEPSADAADNKLFRGQVKLEVASSGGLGQVAKFTEQLRKIRGIELESLGSCVEGKTMVILVLAGLLPLLRIIEEMPLVEEVVDGGSVIKVVLKIS